MRMTLAAASGLALTLAGFGGEASERRPPVDPVALQPSLSEEVGFDAWVTDFRSRALQQGISPRTLDMAFEGMAYVPEVIQRDRNQAEFVRPIWDYLDGAVSNSRVETGRQMLVRHRSILDRIEARYGVAREVVVAVWGMESSYGKHLGSMPVIPSLATLAYDGRRRAFFEEQLVAALQIAQAGDVDPRRMTGSWAGAMGHTQFMPTSYLRHAVDFQGDGRRDIWSDDPTDALASTAAYLAENGWTSGQPWGREVILPAGFDPALTGKTNQRPGQEWRALGIRMVDGTPVADNGASAILLPAGAKGPALMIYGNFQAISRYNAADSYVIGVGHLADRLRGGAIFRTAWPRGDRPLSFVERTELQERLTVAGYDTGGADGKLGPNTMAAIRAYQVAEGLAADGYASMTLLQHLR